MKALKKQKRALKRAFVWVHITINRQMTKSTCNRFYTKDEWFEIGRSAGLRLIEGFETSIRFPRKKSASVGFDDIIKRHDEKVIKWYNVEIVGDEILITEKVNNLLFCNEKY